MKYCHAADGLRGLASLNVVLAHFVCAFIPGLLGYNYPTVFTLPEKPSALFEIISHPFFSLLYNGELAVIIFFVLSGYVLTIPYFEGNTDKLKSRLWGRYVRLGFPVAVVSIIAFILVKNHLFFTQEASTISGSTNWLKNLYNAELADAEMLKLIGYRTLFYGDSTLNTAFWTLKVEFIGSLLLLAFYICKPKGKEIPLTILMCCILYLVIGSRSIYFICLFLGALLNVVDSCKKNHVALFAISCYLGAFQYTSEYYDYLPEFLSFERKSFYNLISALLLVYIIKNGFMNRLLESKAINLLGKISFSMYLVHVPILCSVIAYLYINSAQTLQSLFWIFAIYLLIVFVVSVIFYKFIDQTSITLSRKLSYNLTISKINPQGE